MMISIIAAISKNRVIGGNNKLLWKLPADLKHFKNVTSGKTVIMGRKTFESIGKPLPNRKNIIVTRDINYRVDDCIICGSIEDAVLMCDDSDESFIIGGGEIYTQSLNLSNRIYLTLINQEFDGDTYFPDLGPEWVKVSRIDHQPDEKNKYKYSFIEYEKCQF